VSGHGNKEQCKYAHGGILSSRCRSVRHGVCTWRRNWHAPRGFTDDWPPASFGAVNSAASNRIARLISLLGERSPWQLEISASAFIMLKAPLPGSQGHTISPAALWFLKQPFLVLGPHSLLAVAGFWIA